MAMLMGRFVAAAAGRRPAVSQTARLAFSSTATSTTVSDRRRRSVPNPKPAFITSPSTLLSSSVDHYINQQSPSSSRLFASTAATVQDADPNTLDNNNDGQEQEVTFYSTTHETFESLGISSPTLLNRLDALDLHRPTTVQAQAYQDISERRSDVTVGAETGSGKTLAYLLPLMDDILQRKAKLKENEQYDIGYDFCRAVILVPNKELVQQVIRMALPLAGGPRALVYGGNTLVDPSILMEGTQTSKQQQQQNEDENDDESTLIRLAIMPGGLDEPVDFAPFRNALGGSTPPVDLVVTTPASMGPLGLKPKNIDMFADIRTLVVDEADMLLEGGFIRSLEQVLMGFRRADKLTPNYSKWSLNETVATGDNDDDDSSFSGPERTQHVFVAATLPDYGLRSVDAYLQKKFPRAIRLTAAGMHKARHSGLAAETVWVAQDSKRARMEELVRLLSTPSKEGGLKKEKVMVFLNKVNEVEGACDALVRAGFEALPYHAKIKLEERVRVLNRFRQYNKEEDELDQQDDDDDDDTPVPLLVCTDLAARGLDVPGVTAVVQLQFAGNVVAHLHRMGRTGRAGQRTGRGFVFYSDDEAELIEVVRQAEAEQEGRAEASSGSLTLEGPEVQEIDDQLEDENSTNEGEHGRSSAKSNRKQKKPHAAGTINKAFSRKRSFKNKIKQRRREERRVQEQEYEP